MTRTRPRRWLVPEVIQTSAMDCGPASLKCLLEGFGIPASYGRLREACQTDVDGTSIDTIEAIAVQLGLGAEQVMVPPRHLLLASADALPAIVVVRLPNGFTHFVVVWRRHGPLLQIMDPAAGRLWITPDRFLERLYIHSHEIPVEAYREWITSEDFLGPFHERLARIGARRAIAPLFRAAVSDPSWQIPAALDASTAMVESLVESGSIDRGPDAEKAIAHFFAEWKKSRDPGAIPVGYWTARPVDRPRDAGDEHVLFRGAVAVRVEPPLSAERQPDAPPASRELVASLREPKVRPGMELLRTIRSAGSWSLVGLASAIVLAAAGTALEAILFRGLFDLGRVLALVQQRIAALAALVVFMALMAALELPVAEGTKRLGRSLETRLRIAFLEKIPRLGDRYFHSRPISDMAERSHSVHRIRGLPELFVEIFRNAVELIVTASAIAWLDPHVALVAFLGSLVSVGVSVALLPWMNERDLRLRSHTGTLARFYLDALQGLLAIRSHGAEPAVSLEHEALLVEWVRTARSFVRTIVVGEVLQALAGLAVTVWIVFEHVRVARDPSSTLLLLYWALGIPLMAERFATALRQYPAHRNVTLRLLEPLGALDEPALAHAEQRARAQDPGSTASGVALSIRGVGVVAGGHEILKEIDLDIEPGEHVAIVGPSGSGKSSLVGLLLGWHRAVAGSVVVDGALLDGGTLDTLRGQTAWVDPGVRLWNRSLVENLHYGNDESPIELASVIEAAELRTLLERLPDGMQTELGEGGALVSGGEGQRVRLGRAMMRQNVRLVILDEPFRGLDRERRTILLASARELWEDATLLCITHDVRETLAFGRALVMDGGKVVEDGAPEELVKDPGSRYGAMLETEDAMRAFWASGSWRRVRLDRGRLEPNAPEEAP